MDILCIGSALWDQIGRHDGPMGHGADMPGRIRTRPGGVAMNIALTLRRFGLNPQVLTALGKDEAGRLLLEEIRGAGLGGDYIHIMQNHPTDRYMAIEDTSGLVAAVADAHTLEAAGDAILAPLRNGPLGTRQDPYRGAIALDGNLTEALLSEIAADPAFERADLRIAPASPGKAARLAPLLGHPGATLYVNRAEAGTLAGTPAASTEGVADTLVARGATRVLVTDGGQPVAEAGRAGRRTACPIPVQIAQITGAGDTFMAAHIAAELGGASPEDALQTALDAAAGHVSGQPDMLKEADQ